MIGFLYPALLLLTVPLLYVVWLHRGGHPVTTALRTLAGVIVICALAGPYLRSGDGGRDVVVLVDRSRSMPSGADETALEVVGLAEEVAGPEDRVHILAFGAEPRVEKAGGDARFDAFRREIDPDGSDLAGALDAALELLGGGRGSILLLSDGESQGRDPLDVARRAALRGVRIDVRQLARPNVADVSVERIALPDEIAAGEPFQFDVWIRSDRRVEREVVLTRGDRVLARGKRTLEPGLQRITFRDVLGVGGVAEYEVALEVPAESAGGGPPELDRVPENDRARGATLVTGPRPVLLLNESGADDTLSGVLRSAGLAVDVRTPENAHLDVVSLTRYRAVVLENVAASRIGRSGMVALRRFVEDHGGGLWMTGGFASFGAGGYHRSPLDEVLPVSTELRQEHRKMRLAIATVLDRSGSMSMPVAGNRTKMDLANAGAAAMIKLLMPRDAVSVIAVDSEAHIIQELVEVSDPRELIRRVKSIQSMGGGIFVYNGLVAAKKQLERAPQSTRHVILFADAADAEQPEGCRELIAELRAMNTTLSVIALGTELDTDANFLKDCASWGGGEAYFTTDPAELPRLFAMDTLTVSRSTFVEEPTATRALPGLLGMGALQAGGFPTIDGYNLCYLRPSATAGAITVDEYAAPVFAFHSRGLGRAAALTAQVDGQYGASLVAWPGFPEFAVTVGRWVAGTEPPEAYFASARREGREAVVTVEVDRDAALPADTSRLVARFGDADGSRSEVALVRVDDGRFEARVPLEREGTLVGTVEVGDGESVPLAPLTLPYSPEYERGPDPERGDRVLRAIARETGGAVGASASTLFEGTRGARLWRLMSREFALVALMLLLLEIAGRRLHLWQSLKFDKIPLPRMKLPALPKRAPRERASVEPRAPEAESPSAPPPPAPPAEAPKPSLGSALQRARRESSKKLDR